MSESQNSNEQRGSFVSQYHSAMNYQCPKCSSMATMHGADSYFSFFRWDCRYVWIPNDDRPNQPDCERLSVNDDEAEVW